jgi:hypothetical protein
MGIFNESIYIYIYMSWCRLGWCHGGILLEALLGGALLGVLLGVLLGALMGGALLGVLLGVLMAPGVWRVSGHGIE